VKILLRVMVIAAFWIPLISACESTSSGGSQTNWVHCTTSADCKSGEVCRDEHCQADISKTSLAVRTSCVERLDSYWGQCLAFESECHGDTATLRVVRTAICNDNGRARLSCTDAKGQHVLVDADVPAFGGNLPELDICACDSKTNTARDADLKVAAEGSLEDILGCRVNGVSVAKGSIAYGGGGGDAGTPEQPYGRPASMDPRTCPSNYGTGMGGCMSFGACFHGCTMTEDCPAAPSGSPSIDCVGLPGFGAVLGKTCILHCDSDHACPDGMVCASGFGLGDACLWATPEHAGGCP
jgi:hypothetical protein